MSLPAAAEERAANGPQSTSPRSYSPYQTALHRLHSPLTGADYNVYVAVPRGYESSGNRYPVVVLQDGDYSFPIAQSVALHLSDREGLPPLIIVGIAYPGGIEEPAVYRLNRTRDFTPTRTREGDDETEFQEVSGGAASYAEFLASELKPFLSRTYRIKSRDWTYVGHSYGGLLGSYLLLNMPELFQRYLLVSPSLWYDNQTMLRQAAEKAPLLRTTYVTVFLAVGAREKPRMAEDLRKFAGILRRGAEGGVTVDMQIFEDENHDTVFPMALTRGLRTLFHRSDQPALEGAASQ